MVLEVSFEDFAQELASRNLERIAYMAPTRSGSQLTAGNPSTELILYCRTSLDEPKIEAELAKGGIEIRRGAWIGEEAIAINSNFFDCHVVGVAYRSDSRNPGLWMEAFDNEPTQLDVLRQFYREFQLAGFGADLDMDSFIRAVEPTVVILGPDTIRSYAQKTAALLTNGDS